MTSIRAFAGSDRGRARAENEDSHLLYIPEDDLLQKKGVLAIVADGVGGGPAGKRASAMAVELIKDFFYRAQEEDTLACLRKSLQAANLRISEAARQDQGCRGMATTCTAFVMVNGEGFLVHAGDSRAYLFREGELQQLSRDHTLVHTLVSEGLISEEEGRTHPQRNIILKALGSAGVLEPDTGRITLQADDTLLLCTDGLHGYVSDEEIASVLRGHPVEEAGKRLIGLALERGGADNVTVVVLHV